VAEERKTVRSILAALADSGLEKVVAESTYGALPGDGIGDLGTLYELEQGLARQPIPVAIIRGAYYMSNWEMTLTAAGEAGRLDTLYPADFTLPMVAPEDIAAHAAQLLTGPVDRTGLHFVEGPARYTPSDVAAAFAKALKRPVGVSTTPPRRWRETLEKSGFVHGHDQAGDHVNVTLPSTSAALEQQAQGREQQEQRRL
jgi:uncharacterized protein YbjT (DUF2867 family)